ncbi:MAG: hypothetical protein QW445_07260 [Candidatus Bathyarchaeia archaeon]
MFFKLRPSSHSDDYTIIAKYQSKKDCQTVYKKLQRLLQHMKTKNDCDWSPDEAYVNKDDLVITFGVYTAGYLDEVEDILGAKASDIQTYCNYQELEIEVELPAPSLEASALAFSNEELKLIAWLKKHVSEPKIEKDGDCWVAKWFYAGDAIYNDYEIIADEAYPIDEWEKWKVNI